MPAGFIKIESEAQLLELAKLAQGTFDTFERSLLDVLTPARVAEVRRLRVDDDETWRGVAQACHDRWGGSWSPPSNQLMGMALCKLAAIAFGEDSMKAPWN